eukprot:363517-Chlamydomonas_euryale.AAC.2
MPDEFVVRQLLFAEGLVSLGGVVDMPRPTWRDGALAALRPGGGGMGWLMHDGVPFVTAHSPLLDLLCLARHIAIAMLNQPLPTIKHFFYLVVLPRNSDSDIGCLLVRDGIGKHHSTLDRTCVHRIAGSPFDIASAPQCRSKARPELPA